MSVPPVQYGRIPGVIGVTSLSGRLPTPLRSSAVRLLSLPIHIAPNLSSSPPLPTTRWIGGFPKGADSAASLPLLMRMKLRVIADWIVQCIQPGAFPIVKITAVGHAELREPFALAVSLKRAAAVLEALQNEIRDSFAELRISLIPYRVNLRSPNDTIRFKIDPFSSIANKRKVELIFERSQTANASLPRFFVLEVTNEAMREWTHRLPPLSVPPVRWWELPTVTHKDEWRDIVNYLRNDTILKHVDAKTIVESLYDMATGDPPHNPYASDEAREAAAEKWVEDLAKEWAEFDRRVQERTAGPGDDSEDPPEPVIFNTPSFTRGPDQTVPEDAGKQTVPNWATNIGAVPPVTFKVIANTNPRLFSVGPAVNAVRSAGGVYTGTLTYTPSTHARGTATITLLMQDSGSNITPNSNTSAPRSFQITVGP